MIREPQIGIEKSNDIITEPPSSPPRPWHRPILRRARHNQTEGKFFTIPTESTASGPS